MFATLSPQQRTLVHRWLPDAQVVHDHSWGLIETTVLEVMAGGIRFIVKAAGPDDRQIGREIHAHRAWLRPWTARGRAPELVHADEDARLLVTRYLPGRLVLGGPGADDPTTYRQAGELLAAFHHQVCAIDVGHEARENARALAWLDGPHRIDDGAVTELRRRVSTWPVPPATVVPTHGDYQPRNWVVDDGVVSVIDFGRAAWRPASADLVRLSTRDFARDRLLEQAFLQGYGSDPREPEAWHRQLVREAIGTAAWAFKVGDEGFEAEGIQQLAALGFGRQA